VNLLNLSRQDKALHHYECFLGLGGSDEEMARAARKVATVHLALGDLAQAQEYYEAALARVNDLPLLAETSRVNYCLAYLFSSRNQLEEASRHARASLEISRKLNDHKGLADAHRVMSIIADQRGDVEADCAHCERSLELYRQVGDLPRIVVACNNVGDSYRLLGQMDRALERLNEGLEIARRIGGTRDEASLLQTMAELLLDQGNWQLAVEQSERAVTAAVESGVASRIIEAHRVLGAACEAVGRLEDARRYLETAETLMRETQQSRFAPAICLALAQVSATRGELREARKYLGQALEAAGSEASDAFLGLVHRCQGYLQGCGNNWTDALAHLERSLTLLESANLPVEVGRTCLSLGTAYANRGQEGDRGRACEHLIAALSIFEQMGAQGYVAQVQMRLEESGCLP
jgi:tetratricopeptide (TPR) repeat protein